VIKIAFLFLTISNIVHERVWENFFQGHESAYSLYIHAKETVDVTSVFKKHEMTTKVPTSWGYLMPAQIELLKEALKDPLNKKFIFCSDDSAPIQNFDYVYQQVLQHPLSIADYLWNHHQDRDNPRYVPRRILKGIPSDKQFKNSQWVILNRKHAEMMVKDTKVIDIVTQYFCADEHYPITFLAMHNCLHEVVNQATTLYVWRPFPERPGPHPLVFNNVKDFYQKALLVRAMNQGVLFARKFDKNCDMETVQAWVKKYGYKAELQPEKAAQRFNTLKV
jgi:hypothetical protein